jgi:hypothetical protein
MNIKMLKAALAGLILSASGFANAGLIFTVAEVGSDVVITGSGSFDLTGTTLVGDHAFSGFMNSSQALAVGNQGSWDGYTGFTSNSGAFGTGSFVDGSVDSGDVFGLDPLQLGGVVFLPTSYVSGDALSGSTTLVGHSFASLGLNTGTYQYATTHDTITIQVSVPEPSTLAIFALGMIGLASRRFKKQ